MEHKEPQGHDGIFAEYKVLHSHLAKKEELIDEIEKLESGKGYMLEEDHLNEIKELKKAHQEELDEEVYQLTKKNDSVMLRFEKENCDLKHQVRMLEMKVKHLETLNENQSNQSCDSEEDDEDDVYKV